MDSEIVLALSFVGVSLIGIFVGAAIRGIGFNQAIAEIKADKAQVNSWTDKLAGAIPAKTLDQINLLAQNGQEVTRFLLQAQFPGVPFVPQLREIAGVAADIVDIVEDVTDKVSEPIPANFQANKGLPPRQPVA